MGTSSTSRGPGSGVPLVPPWVPNPEIATEQDIPKPIDIAPPRRFREAREQLGVFARTGDRSSLGKALEHYAGSGLGGAKTATRRMGGAAKSSSALYGVLNSLRENSIAPTGLGIDKKSLSGRPTKEIIDRITQLISPSDGTLDAESSRRAISKALSDLLSVFVDADISSLTDEQIEWVIERHIVYEIYQRIELDVGKTILDKAPSPSDAIERQEEIRSYIEEKVAASFRARNHDRNTLRHEEVQRITSQVIQDTFKVFEEYIQ